MTKSKIHNIKIKTALLITLLILFLSMVTYISIDRFKTNVKTKAHTSFSQNPNTPTSPKISNKGQLTPTDKQTNGSVLQSPSGTFVSNHNPGLNGTPDTEQSVCNINSGTTCFITFSNGSIIINLPAQIAGPNGSVSWNNWTPTSIGLTAGSWTITATASLGSFKSYSKDSIPLRVQ